MEKMARKASDAPARPSPEFGTNRLKRKRNEPITAKISATASRRLRNSERNSCDLLSDVVWEAISLPTDESTISVSKSSTCVGSSSSSGNSDGETAGADGLSFVVSPAP